MYAKEHERVDKKINELYLRGFFENKSIYLFGVSDNTRQIISMLKKRRIEVVAVLDNDVSKHGSYCARKPVMAFSAIEQKDANNNLYLVYSAYWKEMLGQLENESVPGKNILLLYKKRGISFIQILKAVRGLKIYKKIKNKYNTTNIFLCPYTGTGDVYLIGTFWKEYCEKNEIEEYAFLVISKPCQKVAQLCEIENIEVLQRQELSEYIICAHMLWPDEIKLKLLNDCWSQIHTNQIEWFRGYKGLEFTSLFKRYVFNLPDNSKPRHPIFKDADSEIEKIVMDNGLIPGKTVVLSPYSNTLADLPEKFWKIIAEKLLALGYTVCTNSSSDSEPAIEGTVSVFFPLTIAPQFIEKILEDFA